MHENECKSQNEKEGKPLKVAESTGLEPVHRYSR